MIRVLHAIDTSGPGGAETVFLNLIDGLDRRQFSPQVAIGGGDGWLREELLQRGLPTWPVAVKGSCNQRYLRQLLRIIKKEGIDLVQSHLLGSNLYCSLAGILSRTPVVSTFHGFVDAGPSERFLPLKLRLVNGGSSRIVFVSDRLAGHYRRLAGESGKYRTIYNGVDLQRFSPGRDHSLRRELGVQADKLLIGAIGNIRPAKGYEFFLRAARQVVDAQPHCRFVIVGEGGVEGMRRLQALRQQLGLQEVVHFAGFRADTAAVLRNLDLYLLSSVSEGFSIACIEAMACGLPVVATRSGGPEEIIEDGRDGLLVPAASAEALAHAVLSLLAEPVRRRKMAACATASVARRFALQTMLDSYTDLYQRIVPDDLYR
jgi:glycosyltransferase involved in cell wall biosynthesis